MSEPEGSLAMANRTPQEVETVGRVLVDMWGPLDASMLAEMIAEMNDEQFYATLASAPHMLAE